MVIRFPNALSMVLASLLFADLAQAGGLTRELVCDTNAGGQPEYVERDSSSKEAFSADVDNGRIFINPFALSTRPQPVVNYEFAVACLQVARRRDDMCSAVRFLRERNLLFSSDLDVLQTYFAARARTAQDREEADGFIRRIKALYACF